MFAVAILNLVPRARIELAKTGYQPIIIPFNYPGIQKLATRGRIELPSTDRQSAIIAII